MNLGTPRDTRAGARVSPSSPTPLPKNRSLDADSLSGSMSGEALTRSTPIAKVKEALAALDLSRPVSEHPEQYAKLLDALQRALNQSRS